MLQNHPGEKDFPVKNDWGPKASLRLTSKENTLVQGMWTIAIITLVLALISGGVVSEAQESFIEGWIFVGSCTLAGVVCLGVVAILLYSGATRRVNEQRIYYQLGGLSDWYPENHRAALQLDGINAIDLWSETLECWPCERRLNGSLIDFKSFQLNSIEAVKAGLDDDWGVLTREDYERRVGELMQGLHTRNFLEDSLSHSRSNLFQRLSDLTGLSVSEVESVVSSSKVSGKPPRLIWAWDWWRVIPLSRNAYMAGLISEEVAWENILLVSDWIHALFDDLNAYHANLLLGYAYWCNHFAAVQSRKTILEIFERNVYPRPIRDVKWKMSPVSALPPYVLEGLQEFEFLLPKSDSDKFLN